jgi:hypothetical protein
MQDVSYRMEGAVWEVQNVNCRIGVQDRRRGTKGAAWEVLYGRCSVEGA